MTMGEKRKPTTEKLAEALSLAGAPKWMIDNALAGVYDDYTSPHAFPIRTLVFDAKNCGLPTIAMDAIDGKFDAQKWEADEWAKSPEGRQTFEEFFRGSGKQRR